MSVTLQVSKANAVLWTIRDDWSTDSSGQYVRVVNKTHGNIHTFNNRILSSNVKGKAARTAALFVVCPLELWKRPELWSHSPPTHPST